MAPPYPPTRQQFSRQGSSKTTTYSFNPKSGVSLRRSGAPHDAHGLRALLKSLVTTEYVVSRIDEAAALHAHASKLGLDRQRAVRDALVALYLACGHRGRARTLFTSSGGSPDLVSWTNMVTAHARLGLFYEAVELFLVMADGAVAEIDSVAATTAFAACAGARDLALGREAHRRVMEAEVALDAVAWNALVDMYAKCGDTAAARRCFRRMPVEKSVISWNTMISALSRAGELREALALFREMQGSATVRPDDATFVAVLGVCAQLGALDIGMWVHAYMGRLRREADGVVGNALVEMYAKCGAVDIATEVFDAMERRDVYTYTSMISGLAIHGRGEEALALFADMRRAGVRPNEVTLLGVLTACCHAGLVDEGLCQFNAMPELDGVAAGIEHYGCVVDMLGRAGRLDEAEELVAGMPVRPDALVWGSLLSACRTHGHVERAERVMRRMAGELDGDVIPDAGDYVLMSNMYASEGRHGKAMRLRRQMRRNKMDKVPGCSLIEIDGVMHEFRAVRRTPSNPPVTFFEQEIVHISSSYCLEPDRHILNFTDH